jgi:hypothetical protein
MRSVGMMCTMFVLAALDAELACGRAASDTASFWTLDAQPQVWSAARRIRAASARARPREADDDDRSGTDEKDADDGPDLENVFGFTSGTDVGDLGEQELEWEFAPRWSKRQGSYSAVLHRLEYGATPVRDIHFAAGLLFAHHNIRDVPGLDDQSQFTFDGLSFEAKFRLIERALSPVGLTLIVEPTLSRIEEATGQPADRQSIEVRLAADAELVKERLYAAFNVFYEPERTHVRGEDEAEKESTFGMSSALALQIAKGVFVGGEIRHLRQFEGLGLDRHVGHATFLGPTFYARLSQRWWIAAAWSIQVAGHSVDNPGLALDLDDFSRHEARLRTGIEF